MTKTQLLIIFILINMTWGVIITIDLSMLYLAISIWFSIFILSMDVIISKKD